MNLLDKAVAAGAKMAVGFVGKQEITEFNEFLTRLAQELIKRKSVEKALVQAAGQIRLGMPLQSMPCNTARPKNLQNWRIRYADPTIQASDNSVVPARYGATFLVPPPGPVVVSSTTIKTTGGPAGGEC